MLRGPLAVFKGSTYKRMEGKECEKKGRGVDRKGEEGCPLLIGETGSGSGGGRREKSKEWN